MRAAEDFAPQFREWVRQTPPEAVVEHGLFTRSIERLEVDAGHGWGRGRVTFVGDAAHAGRPTGATSCFPDS